MLKRFAARLGAGFGRSANAQVPGPRVLLYHRVFAPERDPQLLCVSPRSFDQQMQWLRDNCTVVTLEEMMQHAKEGTLSRNAVAVTFDDGYFDNLDYAAPLLREANVPATFFVSSGFVDSGREMWWDELERVLLKEEDPSWNVTHSAVTKAQREYVSVCADLKFAAPERRNVVLAKLGGDDACRPTHRALTHSELVELASEPLIQIGGHTVNHVALSHNSRTVQQTEIEADRTALAKVLGRTPSAFAYPFGSVTEVDATTLAATRTAGYSLACANVSGPVDGATDSFRIPREIVRDWDVDLFAEKMTGWLHG